MRFKLAWLSLTGAKGTALNSAPCFDRIGELHKLEITKRAAAEAVEVAGQHSLPQEAAEHLVSKEVVAIGADQWALEVMPFEKAQASSRSIRSCCRGRASYILGT
jgi:hypothetical protein